MHTFSHKHTTYTHHTTCTHTHSHTRTPHTHTHNICTHIHTNYSERSVCRQQSELSTNTHTHITLSTVINSPVPKSEVPQNTRLFSDVLPSPPPLTPLSDKKKSSDLRAGDVGEVVVKELGQHQAQRQPSLEEQHGRLGCLASTRKTAAELGQQQQQQVSVTAGQAGGQRAQAHVGRALRQTACRRSVLRRSLPQGQLVS